MAAKSRGLCRRPHHPAVESTGVEQEDVDPEWKTSAGRAEILPLTPTPWWPRVKESPTHRGSLSRGHPLTGRGMVTFNWLMSGEHFEDEKGQVAIITMHFLR